MICRPAWECSSTLHRCRSSVTGRQGLISMRKKGTGGLAGPRGFLILCRGEAGRHFFSNNEVKRTIAECSDLWGGAFLLPAPCPDPLDLPPDSNRLLVLGLKQQQQEEEVEVGYRRNSFLSSVFRVRFFTTWCNVITGLQLDLASYLSL